MNKYAVWITEYPEDGSELFDAESPEDAMRQYAQEFGPDDEPFEDGELSAALVTEEILAKRNENLNRVLQ